MDIDDEALSKACQLESKCKIHNNLCGSELDVVLDELKVGNKENKKLLIACTQQEDIFENFHYFFFCFNLKFICSSYASF